MNNHCFFLLFVLFITYCISTNANTMNIDESTAEARKQLQKVLPSDCYFTAHFKQTRELNTLPIPLTSTGNLFFSCEHGLIWDTLKPFEESVIYTKPKLHFRRNDETAIEELDGLKHLYIADFLLDILSTNTKNLMREFTLQHTIEPKNHKLVLRPKNATIQKTMESITINKKNDDKTDNHKTITIQIRDTKEQITSIEVYKFEALKVKDKTNQYQHCLSKFNHIDCKLLTTPYSYESSNHTN